MSARNDIVMQQRVVPKRIEVPDGKVFYAKYETIKETNLSSNVRVQRNYKKKKGGKRISTSRSWNKICLKEAYNLGKKLQIRVLGKDL